MTDNIVHVSAWKGRINTHESTLTNNGERTEEKQLSLGKRESGVGCCAKNQRADNNNKNEETKTNEDTPEVNP